jgi:DNA-binding MarR family transcriptional regulator
VALTAKGRQLVDKVLVGHQAQYDRVMGVLSEAELRQLHQTLTRLDEHFQTLAKGDAAASA